MSAPLDSEKVGELGMTLQAYMDYDAAITAYGRAAALDPKKFHWPYYLGQAALSRGRYTEAEAAFRRARSMRPAELHSRLGLAEALLGENKPAESEALYREITQEYGYWADGYFGLGQALARQSKSDAAIAAYEKACEIEAKHFKAHFALGTLYRARGKSVQARQQMALFEKYRRMQPKPVDILMEAVKRRNRRNAIFHDAYVAENGGRWKEAADLYRQALAIQLDVAEVHAHLITAYANLGQLENAEAEYRAALEAIPGYIQPQLRWGSAMMAAGKLSAAEKAFSAAIKLDPRSADARRWMAQLAERRKNWAEAVKHYQLITEIEPANSVAWLRLGKALKQAGDRDGAVAAFLAALEREPSPQTEMLAAITEMLRTAPLSGFEERLARAARKRAEELGDEDMRAAVARAFAAQVAQR